MYKNNIEQNTSCYTFKKFRLGMDIGSTTAKFVLLDSIGNIKYSDYRRHNVDILITMQTMLDRLYESMGNILIHPVFTGSARMGLAGRTGVPFVQEMIAASDAVMSQYPQCNMLIDIGGEDSKFFSFNYLSLWCLCKNRCPKPY